MEDLVVVNSLINWDPSIRYIATLARKRKQEKKPNYEKEQDYKDWNKKWRKRD